MTPDEREILDRVAEQSERMHRALFEVPPGTKGEPLIHDLNSVAKAYSRASWATRSVFWIVPTIAALGLAVEKIIGFWK